MVKKQLSNALTKKDFLLYLINRTSFILATPLIIIALLLGFIYVIQTNGFQNNDLLYLLPILIFIIIYIQIYTSIAKARVNNNVEIEITPKLYKENTQGKITTLELDKFYAYFENKKYFYLYVDKINAIVLPKREFSNEEINEMKKYFSSSLKRITFITLKNLITSIFILSLVISIIILVTELVK